MEAKNTVCSNLLKNLLRKFSKQDCIFLSGLFILLTVISVGGMSNSFSAGRICSEAAQVDEDLVDMIGFHNAELRSGAYISLSRRREMLHEEDVKREIAQRSRTVCNEAIELERFDAKYKELSKKFDLKKLDKYPEDDRRKILEAVSLPIDGPHSVTERMRLLQFFDKYPYQYR